jgi:sugar lactone lactonase YvrE
MKRKFTISILTLAGAMLANVGHAQMEIRPIQEFSQIYYPEGFNTPQHPPEMPFDTPSSHWFKMPRDQPIDFGEVAAVATNSKGHVFVLNRNDVRGDVHGGNATQVLEFDETGKYVREIGHNIYGFAYGHGIRIDKSDNIWVVDKGSDMVTEFDAQTGKQLMVLGRRQELTDSYWKEDPQERVKRPPEEGGFAEPTDVAWDSKGNIYVSDGYVHSRVAKFDPHGNWIGTWGSRGDGPGQFWTVHNVQIDKFDHVWVADRSNGRLQVFDTNGTFLRQVILNVPTERVQPLMGHQYPPTATSADVVTAKQAGKLINFAYRPGAPDALCIPPTNPDVIFVADLYPGRVYKIDLDGKVLGYFGHAGKEWGNPGSTHGLACPTENLIYTAEFENDRVERFVLHPAK